MNSNLDGEAASIKKDEEQAAKMKAAMKQLNEAMFKRQQELQSTDDEAQKAPCPNHNLIAV